MRLIKKVKKGDFVTVDIKSAVIQPFCDILKDVEFNNVNKACLVDVTNKYQSFITQMDSAIIDEIKQAYFTNCYFTRLYFKINGVEYCAIFQNDKFIGQVKRFNYYYAVQQIDDGGYTIIEFCNNKVTMYKKCKCNELFCDYVDNTYGDMYNGCILMGCDLGIIDLFLNKIDISTI